MRPIIVAAVLIGCATAPNLREGQAIDVLTPAQLEQAYDRRAACFIYADDGGCESVSYLESSTSATRTTRTVGATDIAGLASDPVAQAVRELAMFQQYDPLFRRLEAQRAAAHFRFVKEVTIEEAVRDPQTNRWCTRAAQGALLENSRFYFSNTLTPDIANDERLTPENEAELRDFLRAVTADRQFRAIVVSRAREHSAVEEAERMFAMLDGAIDNCASYSGVVERGRIELRAMSVDIGGVSTPSLSRAIRPYPVDADPPLRAN